MKKIVSILNLILPTTFFLLDIYKMGDYSGYLFVLSDQWDFLGCPIL